MHLGILQRRPSPVRQAGTVLAMAPMEVPPTVHCIKDVPPIGASGARVVGSVRVLEVTCCLSRCSLHGGRRAGEGEGEPALSGLDKRERARCMFEVLSSRCAYACPDDS